VEILSIASFYVPAVFPGGLVVFRLFRVARILRLFRANAYSDAVSSVFMVIRRKRNALLSSIFIVFIIMIMSSLLMYWFEHDAQPGVFSNAFSGMWWATNALLTVGYGDIYPVTIAGRIAGIAITFLGVGMVAIPTGIMSAGFMEHSSEKSERKRRESETHYCPHCGNSLTESELLDMNSWQ
jgi:voltage-gated potassium channel